MAKQRHAVKNSPLPVYASRLPDVEKPAGEVTLIVPGNDVLLTRVMLPKLSRHRLLQALPYALEDQLIEDVGELHFAIGAKGADGHWPVAVMAMTKMLTLRDAAREAGLSVSRLVPEHLTLPVSPRHWTIDLHATRCVARTSPFTGFACHRDNLATFMEAALADPVTRPDSLHLRCFTADTPPTLPFWPDILQETTRMNPNEEAMLAQQVLATHPMINLLQDRWRATSQDSRTRSLWKMAGGLFAMTVFLLFTSQLAAFFTLKHDANRLRQDIHSLYARHFPEASSMVAPKARLSEKLRRVETEGSRSLFLELLAKIAEPLATLPDIQLEWIDFQNHQLKLGLSATSFSRLDELTHTLIASGLSIKQQNATTATNGVKATLLVRSTS